MTTIHKELTEEELKEFEIYQSLKPYIGHCLILNHELNNPLTGIIGYSEFLIDDDSVPENLRSSLKQILKSAERMQKLIESLCIEKIELEEKIDLSSIIDSYQKIAKDLD